MAKDLTKKERELISLLADGYSPQEASKLLQISIKTVHYYRTRLMSKLQISSIAALTKWAIRNGLTSADSDRGEKIKDL